MATSRVMIVEDESILALYIKNSLENLGYTVVTLVDNGEEAIQKASELQPDLVLMDIRIRGDMDGIDTAEYIYEQFDIPVVYLTAHADENTLQRAKLTKPYGYVLKPFEEEELRPAIEIALHRHKLEMKLRTSERWLATTLKAITDALVVTDLRGAVTYMNPVAEQVTGWLLVEAAGRDLMEIVNVMDGASGAPVYNPALKVIQQGMVVALDDLALTARDGAEKRIESSAAPIRDEKGAVVGAVLIFRDVTGKAPAAGPPGDASRLTHEATQLATQAAQLASLGVMAAGISHEISQPLHAILVSANSVLHYHKRNPGDLPDIFIRRILDVKTNAGRIEAILQHINTFWAAQEGAAAGTTDLNQTVRNAFALVNRKMHTHGIRPELHLDDNALTIRGNAAKLEQVVITLISNSIAALDRAKSADKFVRLATGGRDHQAVLEIHDNGPAIAQEALDNALDPFFSDSGEEDATGLRLAIARMFVEESGGQIEAERHAEGGTTLRVLFPLVTP